MKKNVSKNLLTLLVLAVLFFSLMPAQVDAQGLVPCGGPDKPACQLCHLFVLFDNIVKFLLIPCDLNSNVAIVPLIATLMIVIGGVMFFAAVGDPAKIGKATSLLTAVAIGLVIIYGAWLLVNAFFLVIGVNIWTGPGEGWFKIDCPIEEGGVPGAPGAPGAPGVPGVPGVPGAPGVPAYDAAEIEKKKKEIEEKYPDLEGEWKKECITGCLTGEGCAEETVTADCSITGKTFKDGFCMAKSPTKEVDCGFELTLGKYCCFKSAYDELAGKYIAPEGCAFAYCVSE